MPRGHFRVLGRNTIFPVREKGRQVRRRRPRSPPFEFSGWGFLDSSRAPVLPAGADRLSAPVADVVVDEPLGGLQNGVEAGLSLVGGRRGEPAVYVSLQAARGRAKIYANGRD